MFYTKKIENLKIIIISLLKDLESAGERKVLILEIQEIVERLLSLG